tara:strand:+ start:436 stop:810 length:375 start_codon:yes stop_codon:yes gene_type:complete
MAERYMRYAVNVPANTETTIFTAPNDGESPAGAADSVIIGFFVAATTVTAGTLTVSLTNYYDATVVKLADTIPLPADTSVDIMPGKMVLQHALNNAGTPALTGDIIKVTATQAVSVILSMVERV